MLLEDQPVWIWGYSVSYLVSVVLVWLELVWRWVILVSWAIKIPERVGSWPYLFRIRSPGFTAHSLWGECR